MQSPVHKRIIDAMACISEPRGEFSAVMKKIANNNVRSRLFANTLPLCESICYESRKVIPIPFYGLDYAKAYEFTGGVGAIRRSALRVKQKLSELDHAIEHDMQRIQFDLLAKNDARYLRMLRGIDKISCAFVLASMLGAGASFIPEVHDYAFYSSIGSTYIVLMLAKITYIIRTAFMPNACEIIAIVDDLRRVSSYFGNSINELLDEVAPFLR